MTVLFEPAAVIPAVDRPLFGHSDRNVITESRKPSEHH